MNPLLVLVFHALILIFWSSLSFQETLSPLMEQLMSFYGHGMMILVLISSFISLLMGGILVSCNVSRLDVENEAMEILWTLLPGLVLIFLAVPSIKVLYFLEEVFHPSLTLKIVGHQWYWSYEFKDWFSCDSYMDKSDCNRLLEVDNHILLPWGCSVRALITSEDVIHSWTIPAMGIKADANPGRMNNLHLFSFRPSVVYGQCSEICGINHSYMPIVLEFCHIKAFKNWVDLVV